MLRALEEERFDALGAPVFVRGYLKAYAGLLGLSEQSVLDGYRQADPASALPPKMVREREDFLSTGPRLPGSLLIAGIGILVLVLYFVFRSGGQDSVSVQPTEMQDEIAILPVEEPAVPPTPVLTESAPALVETPPAEAGKLVLEFAQASWVEISDISGRLLSGEQAAGSRHVLSGQPPFNIALGNASGVRLIVDGQPWPVPEGARAPGSNVARFRIESLSR